MVAGRTYTVGSDGYARDTSDFFEGVGAGDTFIERMDREDQISEIIRAFRAAPPPAAMEPAIATGAEAKPKTKAKKRVHFQDAVEVREFSRTSGEVAVNAEHRTDYYVNLIPAQVAVAVECATEAASLCQGIERAAETAGVTASLTGSAADFARAADLQAAAAAAAAEVAAAERAVVKAMMAAERAQEALEEAKEAAAYESMTAEAAGYGVVGFLTEPIVIAREALQEAKEAAKEAQRALGVVCNIAYGAGVGQGIEAAASDDMANLAEGFDRASLN